MAVRDMVLRMRKENPTLIPSPPVGAAAGLAGVCNTFEPVTVCVLLLRSLRLVQLVCCLCMLCAVHTCIKFHTSNLLTQAVVAAASLA